MKTYLQGIEKVKFQMLKRREIEWKMKVRLIRNQLKQEMKVKIERVKLVEILIFQIIINNTIET